MHSDIAARLIGKHKNFVFTGEAGSGKTEVAINLALLMAAEGEREVHFFDMDQTKPLFRARGAQEALRAGGVQVHYQEQSLDAPTVAPAVSERLRDGRSVVLLDVGGGAYGSHMIGQFSRFLGGEDTLVLYLVNPYRPWSGSREDIEETMRRVLGAARLGGSEMAVVANPNFGRDTACGDVVAGLAALERLIPEAPASFVCVVEGLAEDVGEKTALPVLPIRLYTLPEWLAGSGADLNDKE